MMNNDEDAQNSGLSPFLKQISQGMVVASTIAALSLNPVPASADEIGVEVEADTLFTGEAAMICVKRGPLGACLKQEIRTAENDNDKASKYFKTPDILSQEKEQAMRNSYLNIRENTGDNEGRNELVERLKKQTEENREKNERIVKAKTFTNDQSASFGPFDRQIVILNTDGESFTLLQKPQAMRLKKLGYIEGRAFVKQPSQEVLDENLNAPDDDGSGFFGGVTKGFKSIFGSEEDKIDAALSQMEADTKKVAEEEVVSAVTETETPAEEAAAVVVEEASSSQPASETEAAPVAEN